VPPRHGGHLVDPRRELGDPRVVGLDLLFKRLAAFFFGTQLGEQDAPLLGPGGAGKGVAVGDVCGGVV
jgi:hypothetical protein